MSRHISFLRLLLLVALIMSLPQACDWLEPEVESGAVLFQDDFSRSTSGWDRYQDDVYISDYEEGSYRIAVLQPYTEVWARPHLVLSDVRIEVQASKSQGPDDNIYGVICRYQDAENFYFFVVSSDGYGGIGLHREGTETLLSSETMLPSRSIQKGNSINHIRADCVGDDLSLYVNGVLVAQAQAASWSQGDVGIMVGAYHDSGTVIHFDHFTVIKP